MSIDEQIEFTNLCLEKYELRGFEAILESLETLKKIHNTGKGVILFISENDTDKYKPIINQLKNE